jgi:peptidoglycan/xylan/chitin deacetylase (PgdA/CDA1 family)
MSARWIPSRALRPFGRPVALGFHGVARRIENTHLEVNHHTVDDFAAVTKILQAEFDVLPLEALTEVLQHPDQNPRAVFLMSDDGYRNTLTEAADILDGCKLPWSLFVSTHHVETGEPNLLFLARLFFFFAPAGCYAIPHFPADIELGAERSASALAAIEILKRLEVAKARQSVSAMTSVFRESELRSLIERFPSERFLNWSEIGALASRGVAIGAHAHWHWPMNAAQSPEHVQDQARTARNLVIRHVGKCGHFAYPFGNVDDVSATACQAVRDAGYDYAFTTISASLDGSANPWLLPRYMLKPREQLVPALLPMLRAGNSRLAQWQRRLVA